MERTGERKWIDSKCTDLRAFLCQVEETGVDSNVTLVLSKRHLDTSTFHVWWRYRHNDHISMDGLEDSPMSGFHLQWDIEDSFPDLELVTSQTRGRVTSPGLGTSPQSQFYREPHTYRFTLELLANISSSLGNSSLVIQLESSTTETGDQLEFTTSSQTSRWKFYPDKKTWLAAQQFCERLGGTLPSLVSLSQLEELAAIPGSQKVISPFITGEIWLGARDQQQEGNWTWTDGTQWSFSAWRSGEPNNLGPGGENCLVMSERRWLDVSCDSLYMFFCQVEATKVEGSMTLVYTQQDLDFPAFHLCWKYRPSGSQQEDTNRSVTGFVVDWYITGGDHEKERSREEEWLWRRVSRAEPRYSWDNFYLTVIIDLVSSWRLAGRSKQQLWSDVVGMKTLWNEERLHSKHQWCSDSHVSNYFIEEFYRGLYTTTGNISSNVSEEDLVFGTELFTVLTLCHDHIVEAAKLAVFMTNLLDNHNLRTIIQTTVNTIEQGSVTSQQNVESVKEFYKELDRKYNLSLGIILIALSTQSQLRAMLHQDSPYLSRHSQEILQCIDHQDCTEINKLLSELGEIVFQFDFLTSNYLTSDADPARNNHPAHLVDTNNTRMPSAFIPFCAFRTTMGIESSTVLGDMMFPVCTQFQSVIRNGELCHSLEMTGQVGGSGKANGLVILVDTNQERSIQYNKSSGRTFDPNSMNLEMVLEGSDSSPKIYIDNLSIYAGYGQGSYILRSVKKMTGTAEFLGLPDKDKRCQLEDYESCLTRQFYAGGQECGCLPWTLRHNLSQVIQCCSEVSVSSQEKPVCTPIGNDCFRNLTAEQFYCDVTCEGLYADVEWLDEAVGRHRPDEGQEQDRQGYRMMEQQYRHYKDAFVENLQFDSGNSSAQFSK